MITRAKFGGSKAAGIFRNAEEAATATRADELSEAFGRGGPTTSVAATEQALVPTQQRAAGSLGAARSTETSARAGLTPITEEAAQVAGRGASRHASEILGERDVVFDAVMREIGDTKIPVNKDILKILTSESVRKELPPESRRILGELIESKGGIPLRRWDAIRQALGKPAAESGTGIDYTALRNRITTHVDNFEPAYGEALAEYGRLSNIAEGAALGSKVLTQSTSEFVALIEGAGGGTAAVARYPGARAEMLEGAEQGVRRILKDNLTGSLAKAEKFMEGLANNPGLRAKIRSALSPDEVAKLEDLGVKYGHRLRFAEGVAAGGALATRGTAESLAKALQSDPVGVGQGLRGALAGALEEGSESTSRMMERIARNKTYRERVLQVLSGPERQQLTEIAAEYGHQLDIVGGAKVGAQVISGTTEAFEDAVAGAYRTPGGVQGGEEAARGALVSAAGESPRGAGRLAQKIDESQGLQQRIQSALRGKGNEADKIELASTLAARSSRNLDILAPESSEAAMRQAAESQITQDIIGTGVIGTGRASASFLANNILSWFSFLKMSPGTVKKTAEMLVDPEKAPQAIRKLIDMGATPEWILQMYQKAAIAAGIKIGGEA